MACKSSHGCKSIVWSALYQVSHIRDRPGKKLCTSTIPWAETAWEQPGRCAVLTLASVITQVSDCARTSSVGSPSPFRLCRDHYYCFQALFGWSSSFVQIITALKSHQWVVVKAHGSNCCSLSHGSCDFCHPQSLNRFLNSVCTLFWHFPWNRTLDSTFQGDSFSRCHVRSASHLIIVQNKELLTGGRLKMSA